MGPRVADRRHCCAVAVALVAGLTVAGSVHASAAVTGSSPTASPAPCARDLGGVVCTVGGAAGGSGGSGGLHPAPKASPSPSAPAPTRAAAPPAAAPASPPATPAPAHTPTPTPLPNANLALVAASLRSAPFAPELSDVLAHPVVAARPDLRHFSPPDGGVIAVAPPVGGAAPRATPATARRAGHGALPAEVLLAALGATLAVQLLASGRRRRLVALVALALLPVSTDGPGAAPTSRHPATAALVEPAAPPAPPSTAPAPPPAGPALWAELVGVERRLGAEAAIISGQEWEIRRLASVVGRHTDDPNSLPVGEASPVEQRTRLSTLLDAHRAATAGYNDDLGTEYGIYLAAAHDPAQRNALVSGAGAFPTPDAPVAVAADLALLDTQLAQEAAVTAAQTRLQQLATLLPAQMAAIRRHRPFIAPEIAPVSQGFGPTDLDIEPPLVFQGTFFPHFHTGIDVAAPEGTPLHAAADGVVLLAAASVNSAGRLTGYGNYVIIGHAAGFLTLYGHMSEVAVHAGDRVRQGQLVELEGSTGNSTGPHVHFEIRRDGALLDPAPFLSGQLPDNAARFRTRRRSAEPPGAGSIRPSPHRRIRAPGTMPGR